MHPVSASNYMLLLLQLSIKTKFSLPLIMNEAFCIKTKNRVYRYPNYLKLNCIQGN